MKRRKAISFDFQADEIRSLLVKLVCSKYVDTKEHVLAAAERGGVTIDISIDSVSLIIDGLMDDEATASDK